MESVTCNLCGADETKILFRAKERDWDTGEVFNIVRCNRCGLVYLNPRPDKNEVARYYPPETWPRAKEHADPGKATIHGEPWQRVMKLRTAILLKHLKDGRILDIGCGDGYLLKYLKGKGWEVYGSEPSEVGSGYAREVLGLNVSTGTLEDTGYPDAWFNAVSLYAVLEHLPDPLGTLKEVKRILNPDGILFVSVPNFGGLESRIFKKRWVAIKAPAHLYHFTPATLCQMIKRAGFKVLEIKHISGEGRYIMGYPESLRYLLRDYRLYPPRGSAFKEEAISDRNGQKVLWKEVFHHTELALFKTAGLMADFLHLGGNLSLIARR